MQGATDKRLDFGDIECGVNVAKGGRKLETDCGRADYFSNWKGADEAGRELTGFGLEGQVLGREPQTLSLATMWLLRACLSV